MLLLHGGEIHRFFDDLIIIGHLVPVDGLHEWPGGTVVLHVVQQVEELVVIRPVARLASEFVHVGRPAGGFDCGDCHGVNLADAVFPFFGWGMDDVAFTECPDLGKDSFFLLKEHAASFEIADLGDHGALHNRAPFVVFNVAHPARFLECDFFGEALLFEVADGVIVGVGQKVLNWRGGFDIVLEVGHQMGTIALDLLIRGNGAEDYLGELSAVERTICDAPDPVSVAVSRLPLVPTQPPPGGS